MLDSATSKETVPSAFLSRTLNPSQVSTSTPREKKTYAVIWTLQKWAPWICLMPVLVLTDHKSLEA